MDVFEIPSLRIGRIFGIPIEVNATWLLIFGLVVFSLATGYYPALPAAKGAPGWQFLAAAVFSALAFFLSVVLHELGHSVVARAGGVDIRSITLFMLGGVSQMEEEPRSAGREFVMAFAGPGVSLVLAAAFYGLSQLAISADTAWWVWAPLGYLAVVNLAVGVFNLLPGFPLDGGRVLRAILWAVSKDLLKATKWAARTGQAIGWTMVASAVLGVAVYRSFDAAWFGFIGWFITTMAGMAYRQQLVKTRLAGVQVSSIMTSHPEMVDGELTLDRLAHDHFLGARHSRYPVLEAGEVVGLVTLPMLKEVARPDWEYVRVSEIAQRDLDALTVDQSSEVESIIPRLAADRPGALLVIGDGRVVGIVTRSDVISLLERVGTVG